MACINGGFLSLSSIKSTSPHLKTTPNPSDFFLRFKKPFKPAKISIICAGSSGIKAKAATMDDSPVSFGEEPSVVVKVDGERSYPVFIGSGLLDEHQLIQKQVNGEDVLVVTNTTVARLYLHRVVRSLTKGNPKVSVSSVILPDGDQSLDSVSKILEKSDGFNTDCTFVALGGGAIMNLGCFSAAYFGRNGANCIMIPTTLVAQVDFTVPDPVEIPYYEHEKLLTAIFHPHSVLVDTETVNTLSNEEMLLGIDEIIRRGLLGDEEYRTWLKKNEEKLFKRDHDLLAYAIKRSIELKVSVLSSKYSLEEKVAENEEAN